MDLHSFRWGRSLGSIRTYIFAVVALLLFASSAPCQTQQNWQGDSFTYRPKTFSTLGNVINGRSEYCQDCQTSIPCIGGGQGAWVFGIGGAWACNSNMTVSNTQFTGSFKGFFTITGSQTAPSPSRIDNACVNSRCSVTAFGASGMGNNTLTGSILAGSNTLTLTTTYPAGNGTYVRLDAGALKGFVAPNAPTVFVGTWYAELVSAAGLISPTNLAAIDISATDETNGWPYQPTHAPPCTALAQYQTCFTANDFAFNAADAGHPVVIQYLTAVAQTGSSHTFQIAAADDNGDVGPCSPATTVTMTDTPGVPDFDVSSFPINGMLGSSQSAAIPYPTLPSGATKWLVYKDNNLYDFSEYAWLYHSNNPASHTLVDSWVDMGTPHQPSNIYPLHCPTQEQPDYTVRQVTAGAGTTTVTLSGSPVNSAVTNGTVYFDDTAGIQAACNYAVPSGTDPVVAEVYLPPGYYMISSPLVCGATTGRATGFHFMGGGNGHATFIDYEGGDQTADVILFGGVQNGYIADLFVFGAPSGSSIRVSSNHATGNMSGLNIQRVIVGSSANYGFMFNKSGDLGQISEITMQDVTLYGNSYNFTNGYRNWGGIVIEGQNNLNYNFYNLGAARLGSYTETGQVGNGNVIWAQEDYFGSANGSGANINWTGGSVSNTPRLGVHCNNCGIVNYGSGGSYGLTNLRIEVSTVMLSIPVTSAPFNINFINDSITEPAGNQGTAHSLIVNRGTNTQINSLGSYYNTPLYFDISNASFRSINDNFNITSGNHPSIQDYFVQNFNVSPKIAMIQSNLLQGIHSAEVYDLIAGGLAPTPIGGCGSASVAGTDNAGTITLNGAATTTCTIQFSRTRGSARPCGVGPANSSTTETVIPSPDTWTTTTFKFDFPSSSTGRFWYVCP